MNEQLKTGDTLTAETSKVPCIVEEQLGGGGQGVVYRARLGGPQGEPVALKWYLPHAATPQQRATIAALIAAGAPSTRFLWPQELVSAADKPGFGYSSGRRSSCPRRTSPASVTSCRCARRASKGSWIS
jgi:eukaryotic-like serine/threonine-protein kinase